MGIFSKKSNTDEAQKDADDIKADKPKTAVKKGDQPAKAKPAAVKAETKDKSMKDLYSDGSEKPQAAGSKTGKKTAKKPGNAYRVLLRPLITEKAARVGTESKYMFAVAPKANKIEIAKAIDEVYGVKPMGVNIIKIAGKKVRYGKITGRKKDLKKAIVTLPKGKTINIYEGV